MSELAKVIYGGSDFIGILHVNDAMQEKNLGNEADFKTILDHLQAVYCGKIAYEFMHLPVSPNKFLTALHQIPSK